MSERIVGGVPESMLKDIAANLPNGRVSEDGYIFYQGGWIAAERLGISSTPDPLGTVTTTTRFSTLSEGLEHLDATRDSIV